MQDIVLWDIAGYRNEGSHVGAILGEIVKTLSQRMEPFCSMLLTISPNFT